MKVGVSSTVQTAPDGNVKALLICTSVEIIEIVIGQVLIVLKKLIWQNALSECLGLLPEDFWVGLGPHVMRLALSLRTDFGFSE